MNPDNLEFPNESQSRNRRLIEEDHTVQYADLTERRPKYVNFVWVYKDNYIEQNPPVYNIGYFYI